MRFVQWNSHIFVSLPKPWEDKRRLLMSFEEDEENFLHRLPYVLRERRT